MSWPCCYGTRSATCTDTVDLRECDVLQGIRGPEGALCFRDNQTHWCWSCQDFIGETQQGFCFEKPNGEFEWFHTWAANCERCSGTEFPFNLGLNCFAAEFASDCEEIPEVPPSGCRMAAEDRVAPDGRQWTADLLGTVGLGIDEVIHSDGYTHTLSSELVRARAESTAVPDPCGHVASELVVLSDSYTYGELCSQPTWDRPESRRRSYAIVRTVENTPSMKDGYQYAIASIQLPSWTEVVYRSHKVYCEAIEE